jgi:NitT/TauT family transport system ATP-binding protein
MSYLVARNLWQEYGDHVVLERVCLAVGEHEFCTIVGASGCGKSTFLRLLLGVERQTRGELLLDGRPLTDEPGPERGIVFQRYSVYPHLDVLHNVMLGLEMAGSRWLGHLIGARRRDAREQALAMLEAVGLAAARDKYPAELSGGMQQRLSIAQSLVCRPKILLLDEPFGALDPGIRADMQALVRTLWEGGDTTLFMVTHDLREAFSLGTRLLVFDKVRHDPDYPEAYGSRITYDIPLVRAAPRELIELEGLLRRDGILEEPITLVD